MRRRVQRWLMPFDRYLLIFFLYSLGLNTFFCFEAAEDRECIQVLKDNLTKCRPSCGHGAFSLYGMARCHPWLTCDDIVQDLHLSDHVLGQGAVKTVTLGEWNGFSVAVSQLNNDAFQEDFNANLETLLSFKAYPNRDIVRHLIQLVGFCKSSHILVTEYHFFGSADKVEMTLQNYLPHLDQLSTRFSLCLDFLSILEKLHTHSDGPRVLCDSNTPDKALSQFLLSDELKLILNDMDAVPTVNAKNNFSIKCGHRELFGDFVAPEQLWPYDDEPFDDEQMPGYNEKIDIWKVSDICMFLTGKTPGVNKLLIHLFNIHAKCKNELPHLRPTARDVLQVYRDVYKNLFTPSEEKLTVNHVHVHEML